MPVDRTAIFDEIQVCQLSLIRCADQLDAVEQCNDQRGNALAQYGAQLDARSAALEAAELDLKNRSTALSQISTIAAERKARIKTLEDNQKDLILAASKLRAQLKTAQNEKERLEKVCAGLLEDKKNLRDHILNVKNVDPSYGFEIESEKNPG